MPAKKPSLKRWARSNRRILWTRSLNSWITMRQRSFKTSMPLQLSRKWIKKWPLLRKNSSITSTMSLLPRWKPNRQFLNKPTLKECLERGNLRRSLTPPKLKKGSLTVVTFKIIFRNLTTPPTMTPRVTTKRPSQWMIPSFNQLSMTL